ncbi:hypothetical protein POM88_026917 [Heracleum sosnowskyi]|uniref:Helicase C-terminal domain-containing protein n=1 Tax=Heracleum sosnowskyi TaxID=360622 RepID=A0AAD8I957_9APIA|nr:hypothetical protein POM88_026917 [Heracleum sosnowskyi]
MCCAEIEEAVNTCSRNSSLKQAEVTDIKFRKPVKNISEGTSSSAVNKKNSAKTASSVQKLVSAETSTSFSGRTKGFDQTFEKMNHLQKLPRVLELVSASKRPVLVCCNFKSDVDDLWMYLKQKGTEVSKLHGSVEQSARGEALQDFKRQKIDVLVSTAKLITGIQFPFVMNVINFDLPQDYCDYKRTLVKAKRTITFINEDSPRNSMLELSADEEIGVPQFITDINDRCRSGIIRCRKPEKELWNM